MKSVVKHHLDNVHPVVRSFLFTCLPSFIQSRIRKQETKPPVLFRTAYLDGLRGIAALFVFIGHAMWTYHEWVEYGYGYGPWDMRLMQLPVVRLFYSGHSMVSLFFVIGGYVSSAKALQLARSRSYEKLYLTLASSLFRRGFRLYLPAFASTFISMWTVYLGFWEPARKNLYMMVRPDNHPVRLNSLSAQLSDWFAQTMGLTNIWFYPFLNPYDPHLWSVPREMKGTLAVILCLLGFSRCRPNFRLTFMAISVIFCVYWDLWECMEFLFGAILAEIDMIIAQPATRTDTPLLSDSGSPNTRISVESLDVLLEKPGSISASSCRHFITREKRVRIFRIAFFIMALYFFSAPNIRIDRALGYSIIKYLVPSSISDPKRFVHAVGSALLTGSVCHSRLLQRPFLTPFAQYLGQISYSFYICHGPIIHMIGYVITPALWKATGWDPTMGWAFSFVLGTSVVAVFAFWAADLFWRGVDKNCVRFSKWIEGVCFENIAST